MAVFFTADSHFSHPNILRFETQARHFSDVAELDEAVTIQGRLVAAVCG